MSFSKAQVFVELSGTFCAIKMNKLAIYLDFRFLSLKIQHLIDH